MKLMSTRTEMFRARIRIILRRRIRNLLPSGAPTDFLRAMGRPELDHLFNALQYGPNRPRKDNTMKELPHGTTI